MKLPNEKRVCGLRSRIFRILALVLALMAASQVLPVTLSGDEPGGGDAQVLTLRPLKICEGSLADPGFLSAQPWVPAAGAAPLFAVEGIMFVPQAALSLPDGIHPAIYRPPRSTLS